MVAIADRTAGSSILSTSFGVISAEKRNAALFAVLTRFSVAAVGCCCQVTFSEGDPSAAKVPNTPATSIANPAIIPSRCHGTSSEIEVAFGLSLTSPAGIIDEPLMAASKAWVWARNAARERPAAEVTHPERERRAYRERDPARAQQGGAQRLTVGLPGRGHGSAG